MKLLRKVVRILVIACAAILAILVLFLAISIAPVDRTPVQKLSFYDAALERFDSLADLPLTPSQQMFSVGFSKINITPSSPTATAGYFKRTGDVYPSVHDSVFVRTMVVRKGDQRVAIVSADLLIIPPEVTRRLDSELRAIGFTLDNTYLGATHTHNSIGNWARGASGLIYGSYDDSVVGMISSSIVRSIVEADRRCLPSRISYGTVDLPELVRNRLIEDGPEDPALRMIEINRSDSSRLLIASFTAHATCLYSRDLELSRDYPGRFVDLLEQEGFQFAMFFAGAVGSHGCSPPTYGWDCIDWMAENLTRAVMDGRKNFRAVDDPVMTMRRVELPLADPQVKILENWRVRPWLFRSAVGEYPTHLTVLRLGDLVLLGTPCDYSGEFNAGLDSLGAARGVSLMVTSFNGGYIGYVTPSAYYDMDHTETQLMNWYPPGTAEYITRSMEKLILSVTD